MAGAPSHLSITRSDAGRPGAVLDDHVADEPVDRHAVSPRSHVVELRWLDHHDGVRDVIGLHSLEFLAVARVSERTGRRIEEDDQLADLDGWVRLLTALGRPTADA